MRKMTKMASALLVLFILEILLLNAVAGAVIYPYSVKIGDTIPYKATTVKNGSAAGSYNMSGLFLTEGMSFQLEVFDAPASSGGAFGEYHKFKAVSGDTKSAAFSGYFLIYTNNASYWANQSAYSYDSLGLIFSASLDNTSRIFTYSAIENSESFVIYKFNIDDGILVKYEIKKQSSVGNYTHFIMEKAGGLFGLPGFELPLMVLSLTAIGAVIVIRKRHV